MLVWTNVTTPFFRRGYHPLSLPRVPANKSDKSAVAKLLDRVPFGIAGDPVEYLLIERAYGNHHPAAEGKLAKKTGGDIRSAGGDKYCIVRGFLWPAEVFPGEMAGDVAVTEVGQHLPRRHRQDWQTLNGVNFTRQLSEDRCLVSASGANLKYFFSAGKFKRFSHDGHYIGLGYGLTITNREGMVPVGEVSLLRRDKKLTWHMSQRCQDPLVTDFPPEVLYQP